MLIQKSIIVKFAKNNIDVGECDDSRKPYERFGAANLWEAKLKHEFKHGQETDDYGFVEHSFLPPPDVIEPEEKEALSTLDIYLDAVIDQLGIRTARDFMLRNTTTNLWWYYKTVGKKPNAGETRKLYEIAGLDYGIWPLFRE